MAPSSSYGVQAAQAVFSNTLLKEVLKRSPDLSPALIIQTGATELRDVFAGEQRTIILNGYVIALQDCFLLSTVLAAIATLISVGSRWSNLNNNKKKK
jgi:hypothetical protein